MRTVPLSKRDLDRNRHSDIARTVLNVISDTDVDHQKINQSAPIIFGHPNAHSMHAEADKNPLPAPGSLCRDDILMALVMNLRKIADVSILTAFRAVEKAKLRTLDIDSLTTERCASATLDRIQQSNPVKHVMFDEMSRIADLTSASTLIAPLLKAGAPEYQMLVRKDGYIFSFPKLLRIYQAIINTRGAALQGDPAIHGCVTVDQQISTYLSKVVIPESWQRLSDLDNDDLELPRYDVLSLFNKDGHYIGRALYNRELHALIPKLYYTDNEVLKGKINVIFDRIEEQSGRVSGAHPFFDEVYCVDPVYTSSQANVHRLCIADQTSVYSVDPATLAPIEGVSCGSAEYRQGQNTTRHWAIKGELFYIERKHHSIVRQPYIFTGKWLSNEDFPLLYLASETDAAEELSWFERHRPKELLPKKTVEFTEKLAQRINRDLADDLDILNAPEEVEAILSMLLDEVKADQIERSAFTLVESESGSSLKQSSLEVDVSAHSDALLLQHPFLKHFGAWTHRVILEGCGAGSLEDLDDVDIKAISAADVLVHLTLLASASVTTTPAELPRGNAATLAVGAWVRGVIPLSQVQDRASVLLQYVRQAEDQARLVAQVQRGIAEEADGIERAAELGMIYAGNRITIRPSARKFRIPNDLKV